jgi:hypothetical protein
MTRKGCDSATEPTLSQAQGAKGTGIVWWGFYISGPGADHNWSQAGTTALQQAGLIPLPIYVPVIAGGKIASQAPENDAEAFIEGYHSRGVDGAGALDTEASMRGDPWTAEYEKRFIQKMGLLGQLGITYAGGFTLQQPPSATYRWWIISSPAPGPTECYQSGQGDVAGVSVDFDFAGDQFPLAHFGYEPGSLPIVEDDMFIKESDGQVYQLIYGGADSYWRQVPSAQAATIPTSQVISDDGGWLSLWKVGAQ